jgi:hypothetical protein
VPTPRRIGDPLHVIFPFISVDGHTITKIVSAIP